MVCEYIFNHSSILLHLANWEESKWPLCCGWETFSSTVSLRHFCLWSDSKAVTSSLSHLFLRIDPSELALHEHFWRHLFSSHLLFGLYLLLFHTALWFPIWGDSIAWWLRWWILTRTAEFKPVLCHSLVSSSVKWDKGQPSSVPGPQEVLLSHYRFSSYCCYSWFGLPSLFTPSCRSLQI